MRVNWSLFDINSCFYDPCYSQVDKEMDVFACFYDTIMDWLMFAPGAVHTQHGWERDAKRSLWVPRGQSHWAAGGATAPPGETNQPGHQVRTCKHSTAQHSRAHTHTHTESQDWNSCSLDTSKSSLPLLCIQSCSHPCTHADQLQPCYWVS